MSCVRRIDGYQYLILKSLLQEAGGHMAAMAVDKEQPPVPSRFGSSSCYKQLLQPLATYIIRGLFIRRA
jgi:hypothetical protein